MNIQNISVHINEINTLATHIYKAVNPHNTDTVEMSLIIIVIIIVVLTAAEKGSKQVDPTDNTTNPTDNTTKSTPANMANDERVSYILEHHNEDNNINTHPLTESANRKSRLRKVPINVPEYFRSLHNLFMDPKGPPTGKWFGRKNLDTLLATGEDNHT